MQIRYPGVVVTSLAMALHAALVGRYLESVFFIIAFCWAWVAVTAFRDRLQSAQSMVLTILSLLLVLVLPVALVRLSSATLAAHLSLAIVPGIISWTCMYIYIRHIRRQDEHGEETALADVTIDWADAMSTALAEFAAETTPAKGVSRAPIEIASTMPAASEPPQNDNTPELPQAEELTLERVTEIVASLRTLQARREAA